MDVHVYREGDIGFVDVTDLTEFDRSGVYRSCHIMSFLWKWHNAPPPADRLYIPMRQSPDYRGKLQWCAFGGLRWQTLDEIRAMLE